MANRQITEAVLRGLLDLSHQGVVSTDSGPCQVCGFHYVRGVGHFLQNPLPVQLVMDVVTEVGRPEVLQLLDELKALTDEEALSRIQRLDRRRKPRLVSGRGGPDGTRVADAGHIKYVDARYGLPGSDKEALHLIGLAIDKINHQGDLDEAEAMLEAVAYQSSLDERPAFSVGVHVQYNHARQLLREAREQYAE